MNLVFFIFCFSLILLLHTYLFYPISITILSFFFKKKYSTDSDFKPFISILISSYNEEKVIAQTLQNLYNCDYPSQNMEILVGSDGSTDSTNDLIYKLMREIPVLKLFEFEQRRGKKFVINDISKEAKGEVLVFCDSNSLFKPDALRNLVKYYADPRVGGVCGRLKLFEDSNENVSGNQEKNYWDYETFIKKAEGSLGTLIGANGAIYSLRRELFIPMPEKEHVVDDLYLALKVLEQNKDFLYSIESEAEEYLTTTRYDEFNRKIRIIPRSLETLRKTFSLLFSKRILISYCYWSHKVIRWFSPLLLIILLVSNMFLFSSGDVLFLFGILQMIFYISGLTGFILIKLHIRSYLFEVIYYFIMTNVALIIGYQKFLMKKHKPTWEPTVRG